ncbi:MAG: 4-hydroxybutyrate dehydrogenase [Clostridium sp.]|jgi:4-hydroxybutyrate dehydrogenase|uniref:4-hydroxybutyrate dehydrogenase n=1 Tax=Clostridium sp. TaxID=1506 RepID=UPI0025BA38DF|nr:4-hydroxybutyrate dehydrogenase [Clostridium sp.]MCH3964511.1 4-hydroxybutyrate dehydrogenase [Clostridium sp.]MCI1714983.1 4-hydroxybutyrate dehydrogenase [Clostridium sp.]MCI1799245.1 4-hydroxybutyrate dehydrogenase [Clostridium sp.]MCI1813166.1 4-hydroxybutyrate dehydrogenase [Clostridium sp.]MCI1870056.1 4-hydroxybutyrate dehydrogenase [Clostridium sp.]
MKLLQVVPEIYKFDSTKEFVQFFNIGKGDLILTNEFLYKPFLEKYEKGAYVVFQEKYGNGEPSDEMINEIIRNIGDKKYDRVIALGGGTVIDISKLLGLKYTKDSLDLFDGKVPLVKDKKLIIVPTTCGTGSEVTNVSVAELKSKHTKKGIAGEQLYADYAVLIPEVVKGLPYKFFVTSSVDALIHASESYLSPKATPYTEIFSVEAIKLILNGYISILEKGQDYRTKIIEDFVLGSNYAGIAFGNAGCAAVHALSYPIGGNYHVPHGEANYLFFTEIFKTYIKKNPEGKIKKLNNLLSDILQCNEDSVYEELAKVLDKLLPRKPLREYGMKEEEIEIFTDEVIKRQQRLLVNSYEPFSRQDIVGTYKKLY